LHGAPVKLLLDESLPRRLKASFEDHETRTVPEMGWQGTKNGELLQLAAAEFDVFVTADQNLQYQQNLAGVDIGIIVLAAVATRLDDLLPLVPAALHALESIRPGDVVRVAA
jgi:predicted nuclease of predicted toxin-antitoxin system